jgi:hypothetical protein
MRDVPDHQVSCALGTCDDLNSQCSMKKESRVAKLVVNCSTCHTTILHHARPSTKSSGICVGRFDLRWLDHSFNE